MCVYCLVRLAVFMEMVQSVASLYLDEYFVSTVGSSWSIFPLELILHPSVLLVQLNSNLTIFSLCYHVVSLCEENLWWCVCV